MSDANMSIQTIIAGAYRFSGETIREDKAILQELGWNEAMPLNDAAGFLVSAIEHGHQRYNIRTLFTLLCAVRIRMFATLITLPEQDDVTGPFYLLGMWDGIRHSIQWMTEDATLQLFRELHHREIAALHRGRREPAQRAKQEKSVRTMKRVLTANPGMSVLEAAKRSVQEPGADKDKIQKKAEKLFLQYHEKTFDQAVNQADSEWENGEAASHVKLTEYLSESFFSTLKPKERELARIELRQRLGKLAKEKYPERLYGSPGVKKDD